jgi:hypothetical protein
VHYLKHILIVWSSILPKDQGLLRLADETTVEALQLRVPGLCSEDSEFLEGLMNDGVLFPSVKSQQERQTIWRRLLQVRTLIPSLYTFFEDIKYIKPQVKIIKQLLGKSFNGSLIGAMNQTFSGVNQNDGVVRVQETESSFRFCRGNSIDQKRFGIFQLLQFPARNFTNMIPERPKKEDGKETPVPKTPDISTWQAFATLAYNLGFECEQIHRLRNKNPDRERARAALLQARDPLRFKYEETAFESFQSQIAEMFATAVEISPPSTTPAFFVDVSGESLERRCGRTFENAYESDRQSFFLNAYTLLFLADRFPAGLMRLQLC